jgi:hypothetical protein
MAAAKNPVRERGNGYFGIGLTSSSVITPNSLTTQSDASDPSFQSTPDPIIQLGIKARSSHCDFEPHAKTKDSTKGDKSEEGKTAAGMCVDSSTFFFSLFGPHDGFMTPLVQFAVIRFTNGQHRLQRRQMNIYLVGDFS